MFQGLTSGGGNGSPGGRSPSVRAGVSLAGAVLVLAAAGCSSSGGKAAAPTVTTTPSTTAAPTTSTTLAALSGTHSIDILWNVSPEPGVACPSGLTGSCTEVKGSGSDNALGALGLQEWLATPTDSSCSTAAVAGTFTMQDAASSSLTYTGTGNFCWSSTDGSITLKPVKGTGQFAGVTGTLVAKITTTGNSLKDEWTGQLTFKA